MVDQDLPTIILSAFKIFYQKKELSFIITPSWALEILIFQQTRLFGIFHAL